MRDKDKKIK